MKKGMIRQKQLGFTILAIALAALLFVTACAQAPTPAESLPPSPPEPEEPEERPIYISSLAWELEALVFRGELEPFLQKYPIRSSSEYDSWEWAHEMRFGKGGNIAMVGHMPADNIYQAKVNVENAIALLTKGKLPTESESRPLDKNEVHMLLAEAKSLLEQQRFSTQAWEENAIEWAAQPGLSTDISNEATRVDIIETFDDYRQRLSTIISKLDRIISDLPKAVEYE